MLTESWVEGKSVEEKDAQPTERTAALWGLSSKINSRIWVDFTRNGLRLGSRHKEPPHTDVSRNLATVVIGGVLPGLKRRRTGLLPSGPKSSFQMRASFVFHLETKVLEAVDQHSTGHNQQPDQLYAKRKCVELRETNGGHTRYWLVFVRDGLSRQRRSAHYHIFRQICEQYLREIGLLCA